ncbi:hypothetical protein GCM10010218_21320 [Streptomyces mashuensis]|uniref:SGNH hydrolase-type esterase domain-containing protein n=1 Tax=Streptomyces mashuensis TaxID=33904 RepID=A0A919B374_9ACTN|nr:hypothetical protein GCM10010218_21320 [Streptomyces mashuensis]
MMPLGDSITEGTGSSTGSSYRAALWDRLTGHADRLDFVGSMKSGRLPDTDHEGHYGWKIGGLSANIDTWLPPARPNVVLLHIGTNDVHDDYRTATAPARLGALVDRITSAAPDMTVLVASLVPSNDAPTQKRIEAFNATVPGLVAERRAKGRHVGYVGMGAVTPQDISDDLHPNDRGYAKMADAFYDGIARAAADGWIRQDVAVRPAPPRTPPPGDYRVDADGDGRDDYLVVEDNGVVKAWLNKGGTGRAGWTERGTFATGVGEPGSKVRFADIDGDGKADYLVLQDNDVVKGWINKGGTDRGSWAEFGTYATGSANPPTRSASPTSTATAEPTTSSSRTTARSTPP